MVSPRVIRARQHQWGQNRIARSVEDTRRSFRFCRDTVEGAIAVQAPKIEGARTFALGEEFVVGSQHIARATLQTLRVYMKRWLAASMFWAICAHPVDLPTACSSEDGNAVNLPNFQIWIGVLDMLTLLQPLGKDTVVWPTMFQNKLIRTVALHLRFSGPRVAEEVCRLATDAAPSVIGAANWKNRTYVRVPANATAGRFRRRGRKTGWHSGR